MQESTGRAAQAPDTSPPLLDDSTALARVRTYIGETIGRCDEGFAVGFLTALAERVERGERELVRRFAELPPAAMDLSQERRDRFSRGARIRSD